MGITYSCCRKLFGTPAPAPWLVLVAARVMVACPYMGILHGHMTIYGYTLFVVALACLGRCCHAQSHLQLFSTESPSAVIQICQLCMCALWTVLSESPSAVIQICQLCMCALWAALSESPSAVIQICQLCMCALWAVLSESPSAVMPRVTCSDMVTGRVLHWSASDRRIGYTHIWPCAYEVYPYMVIRP